MELKSIRISKESCFMPIAYHLLIQQAVNFLLLKLNYQLILRILCQNLQKLNKSAAFIFNLSFSSSLTVIENASSTSFTILNKSIS